MSIKENVKVSVIIVGVSANVTGSLMRTVLIPGLDRMMHDIVQREVMARQAIPRYENLPIITFEARPFKRLRDLLERGIGELDEADCRLLVATDSLVDEYIGEVKEALDAESRSLSPMTLKVLRMSDAIANVCARRGAAKVQVVATHDKLAKVLTKTAQEAEIEVRDMGRRTQHELATMLREANNDLQDNRGRRSAFENFCRAVEESLRTSGAELVLVGGDYNVLAARLTAEMPIVSLTFEYARMILDWILAQITTDGTP